MPEDPPARILLFRGRPVTELTREELLVAVHHIQDELERTRVGFGKERDLLLAFAASSYRDRT